jgi:hypothetical protein
MPTPSHTWHKAGALSCVVGAYRSGREAACPQAGGWTGGWASGHDWSWKLLG